jgi:hypothetical protein
VQPLLRGAAAGQWQGSSKKGGKEMRGACVSIVFLGGSSGVCTPLHLSCSHVQQATSRALPASSLQPFHANPTCSSCRPSQGAAKQTPRRRRAQRSRT